MIIVAISLTVNSVSGWSGKSYHIQYDGVLQKSHYFSPGRQLFFNYFAFLAGKVRKCWGLEKINQNQGGSKKEAPQYGSF